MQDVLRRVPFRTLTTVTLVWVLIVGFGELCFAYYIYVYGSTVACYPCADDEAGYMVRPNPFSETPWSQAQADAWVGYHRSLFLNEVWDKSFHYLALACLLLLVGLVAVAIRHAWVSQGPREADTHYVGDNDL